METSFLAKHSRLFQESTKKIDLNVYNYLNALESSFLIYKTPRYDIKGKEILKTMGKYYLADISLLYAAMGFKDSNIPGILENIVFLELKRRGYQVYVGKQGATEIDFVADKSGNKLYIQVAYKLDNQATIDREFGNLLAVSDQYPKYVITLDDFWQGSVKELSIITRFYLCRIDLAPNLNFPSSGRQSFHRDKMRFGRLALCARPFYKAEGIGGRNTLCSHVYGLGNVFYVEIKMIDRCSGCRPVFIDQGNDDC